MKIQRIALLVFSSLFSLSACSQPTSNQTDDSLEKITFVLDWTPNTNHTGLYVAQEKGYFEELGLDVEIVQPSEDSASMLVASGKAQFGISAQDSLAANYASEKPLPITTVAAVLQHNTSGIMSRQGEGIDRPKGLENTTYATWDSPVEQATISNIMAEDGGDFSKVKLIPNTIVDEPLALKEKQTDSVWVFYGWGGIAAEVAEVPIDYFYFKDLNPVFDYYTPVIIANNDFLSEKGDVTKKFLQAAKKGYEFAIASPKEAADVLLKAAPELNQTLVYASQNWLAKQYQAEATEWGMIDAKRWNDFYHWLGENQLVEKNIPENTGFTNDYLME